MSVYKCGIAGGSRTRRAEMLLTIWCCGSQNSSAYKWDEHSTIIIYQISSALLFITWTNYCSHLVDCEGHCVAASLFMCLCVPVTQFSLRTEEKFWPHCGNNIAYWASYRSVHLSVKCFSQRTQGDFDQILWEYRSGRQHAVILIWQNFIVDILG